MAAKYSLKKRAEKVCCREFDNCSLLFIPPKDLRDHFNIIDFKAMIVIGTSLNINVRYCDHSQEYMIRLKPGSMMYVRTSEPCVQNYFNIRVECEQECTAVVVLFW